MMNKIKSKWIRTAILGVLAFLAGGVNGFLGTGGGIILVYTLGALTDNDEKDNFATTLCITIPVSLVSTFSYANNGNIDTALVEMFFLPAVIGGALGAFLTDKLKTKYLKIFFSLLVIYSGICMVVK